MSIYGSFAGVYDVFMEEVDYGAWLHHLHQIWEKYDKKPQTILDLGCGTGNITIPLAQEGFQMIGLDISEDMLTEAQYKAHSQQVDALFICQDMTELELPEKMDCIISLCDSLNYLIEDGELEEAFYRVGESLKDDGLFLFDLNTAYKFEISLGNQTYAATTEDAAYFWENSYDPEEKINEYYVSLFLRKESSDAYERVEEIHLERAYSLEEVTQYLENAGLTLLSVHDGYSFEKPRAESDRLFFIAKVKGE